MGLLVTLGWIALVIGVILVILGYTVAGQALRPGWACLVLGIILVLIGYLVPAVVTSSDGVDTAQVSIAA